MTRNTSISLGDHFNQFIAHQLEAGRFESASEVVRAGLRLLEEEETKFAALRAALETGEKSGFADNYSLQNLIAGLDQNEQ